MKLTKKEIELLINVLEQHAIEMGYFFEDNEIEPDDSLYESYVLWKKLKGQRG